MIDATYRVQLFLFQEVNMGILKLLASDGFLSVNKHIARIVGLDAAVLLAELASTYNYFEDREQLTEDGMFYETVERIEENTTLTKYQQSKAVSALVDRGILETKKIGIPAKRYFRINELAVIALLDHKRSKNFTTVGEKTESQEVEKLDCNNNRDIDKRNNKRNIFVPPTLQEVRDYCFERNNTVDPEKFISYYESNGWKVGRNKMKDWKAAVRTWERNQKDSRTSVNKKAEELDNFYGMLGAWKNS